MAEDEEKEYWEKEDVNNGASVGQTTAGDEPECPRSSASANASENSEEDCYGNPIVEGSESDQPEKVTSGSGGGGEPSTFLFIGPVGKKRKHCREKRNSGDTEPEASSPMSTFTPTTPTGLDHSSDRDPPPLVDDNAESEDSSRSRSSAKSTNPDRDSEGRATPQTPHTPSSCYEHATSTPTSVIRSVPKPRGDDQPLNLSLPISTTDQPSLSLSLSQSPGQRERPSRVSVINLVHRDRIDETPTSCPESSHSPTPSYYSRQPPSNLSVFPQISPSTPSTSDLFPISSGSTFGSSVLSPSAPSTFQGLLVAHGIVPSGQNNGNSSQKKKLKCRDCGKEFSQLRNYKYHRSRHEGTQQFACTCPVCGKTFNDKGYLSSHLKIHRNEKEYKCEWCGKSFNQRVAYNMHIRIHTGHKPHKCSFCPKAFSRKMLLRQHIRTHTGERPYKCSICGKAFADRSNMLLHQRLHSGERPYKCHICGKSFSKNHHLKTHLNHHAGIKPYQCEKCKACFSQSSNMKTHFRKCTGLPNVTSTVTSGSFEQSSVMPGPSSGSGRSSTAGLPLPMLSPVSGGMQPFSISEAVEAVRQEEQLFQQHQRIRQAQQEQLMRLSPSQQQLLHEVTSMNLRQQSNTGTIPSPLPSPTRSGYRGGGGVGVGHAQMGLNIGSISLPSPPNMGRSRRQSGLSLMNPSPTSLAAGHPFIPLTALENVAMGSGAGGTSHSHPSHLSPSSLPSPSSLLLLSPRHHSTLGDLSPSDFSSLQSFSQSITSQQRLVSRSRLMQQQYLSHHQHQQTMETTTAASSTSSMSESRMSLSQSASQSQSQSQQMQIPVPRMSPMSPSRQLSPRHQSQQQLPDYYEVILPALSISRGMSQMSPRSQSQSQQERLRAELFNENLPRPQDIQRVYRVQNPHRGDLSVNGSHMPMPMSMSTQQIQHGLLTVSGDASTLSTTPLPSIATIQQQHQHQHQSQEFSRDSMASMSIEDRHRLQPLWRQREGNGNGNGNGTNTRNPFKDGQFRH